VFEGRTYIDNPPVFRIERVFPFLGLAFAGLSCFWIGQIMKLPPDELTQTAIFVLVGVLGGAVRYLRQIQRNVKDFSFFQMVIALITGGFLGMLTYFLGMSMHMSGPWIGFMCGMAGLLGDEAIKMYSDKFKGGGR
jgi:hypothetical protein